MFLRKFNQLLMVNAGSSDDHPLWSVPIFLRIQKEFSINTVDPLLGGEQWVSEGFAIVRNMVKYFGKVSLGLRLEFTNLVTSSFTLSVNFFRSELGVSNGISDERHSQRCRFLEVSRLICDGFSRSSTHNVAT